MLSVEENEALCRVGPGTLMGELLRRYWYPVSQAARHAQAGSVPERVRLLGEDLVLFRSSVGELGLLDEHCPHRGASLSLARNEDCGLRCLYHGWLVAPGGSVLDTPNEPEGSRLRERVRQVAYQVVEAGGLVWAYLGPDPAPPLPAFDWVGAPRENVAIMAVKVGCNWVQVLEGLIDSSHSSFLHADQIRHATGTERSGGDFEHGTVHRPSNDRRPRIEVEDTPYGFRYAAIRRPLLDADKKKYVRTTLFVAPVYCLIPGMAGWTVNQFPVPTDDVSSTFYNVQYKHDGPVDEGQLRAQVGAMWERDILPGLQSRRGPANGWLQDRAAMADGSWSGIKGLMNEDIACQESMGPVYDRSREHLGTADRAVIHMRRLMLLTARQVAEGGSPIGCGGHFRYADLLAEDGLVEVERPWQDVSALR